MNRRQGRFDEGDRISKNGVKGTFIRDWDKGFIEVKFDVQPRKHFVVRSHGFRLIERAEARRRRLEREKRASPLLEQR